VRRLLGFGVGALQPSTAWQRWLKRGGSSSSLGLTETVLCHRPFLAALRREFRDGALAAVRLPAPALLARVRDLRGLHWPVPLARFRGVTLRLRRDTRGEDDSERQHEFAEWRLADG
jgi:hypothetical protein